MALERNGKLREGAMVSSMYGFEKNLIEVRVDLTEKAQ
jgi:hypothetical protein